MIRATLLYVSVFIATLALVLLVLSAFGTGTMSFPSKDGSRAGFAGFSSGNIYFAWQSFLDGSVDTPHTIDMGKWGQVAVSVPRGGTTSSGRPSTDIESRVAGIGWTSEQIVARLGITGPAVGKSPSPFHAGVFRANYYSVKIPLLWIVFLAGIYPALVARRRFITRQRITHGQCMRCGYDLRESPDRCPECGLAVT